MAAPSPELAEACARMVDARLGIIRRISDVPLQPGEPPLFIVAAHCTRPKYFLRNDSPAMTATDYPVPANGIGLDREEALWRVLGEACERYCGGLYFDDDLITASRAELGSQALPVEDLIAFSDAQYDRPGFPFVRFDPYAPIRWTRGWNLTTREPAYIPAVLVYLGYEAQTVQEMFYPTLSTGMAAGRTIQQALLNALYEVIERDAFTCTWLLRRPPGRLDLAPLKAGMSHQEWRLLSSQCAEATALLVTTDIALPCVVTVLRPLNRRSLVIGAAAHASIRQAVIRATLEAFQTLNWTILLERTPRTVTRENVQEFEDHVRYYMDERNAAKAAWLLEGPLAETPSDLQTRRRRRCRRDAGNRDDALEHPSRAAQALTESRLKDAIALLKQAGYQVYAVETTTTDVRSLGFRTVRVIVPGLQPLNMGYDTVHEDDRRLRRVAAWFGMEMPAALNPEPHPFP